MHGGVVGLQGPYMPAMSEARMLMADHCSGRFHAIEQGATVEFRCNEAGIDLRMAASKLSSIPHRD
jgi:hypothetical protein